MEKEKYLVAVYKSGDEDLFENTLALLKYNRKRMAEHEVRKAREAEQSGMSVIEKLQAFREQSRNTASSQPNLAKSVSKRKNSHPIARIFCQFSDTIVKKTKSTQGAEL